MRLSACRGRERGAALIVVLIFMVVSLVLVLSNMQKARLEESMAGNFRASERALMAAEYGASSIINSIDIESESDVSLEDLVEEITGIAGSLSTLPQQVDPDDSSLYYRIEIADADAYSEPGEDAQIQVRLRSIGEVISGGVLGNNGEGLVGDYKVVASRAVEFVLDVDLAIDSPLSLMCPSSFDLPSNADAVIGEDPQEEVDGVLRRRPAIAAGNRRNARFVVAGIYGLADSEDQPEDSRFSSDSSAFGSRESDVVFMNTNGVGLAMGSEGVYHADGYIGQATIDGEEVPIVNYNLTSEGCKERGKGGGANPMCNFKGGVSTVPGAPAMSSPSSFHKFVSAIFDDDRVTLDLDDFNPDKESDNFNPVYYHSVNPGDSIGKYYDGMINIYTYHDHDYISLGGDGVVAFSSEVVDLREDGVGSVSTAALGVLGENGGFYDSQQNVISSDDYLFVKVDRDGSSQGYVEGESYFPTTQLFYYAAEGEYLLDGEVLLDPVSVDAGPHVANVARAPGQNPNQQGPLLDSGIERSMFRLGTTGQSFGPYDPETGSPVTGEGHGAVVVVDGAAVWGTSPVVNGILVVLGDFWLTGGGGTFSGSLFGAPYYHDPEYVDAHFVCQDMYYEASGGGGFSIRFSRNYINRAFGLLSPQAKVALLMGGKIKSEPSGWTEVLSYD